MPIVVLVSTRSVIVPASCGLPCSSWLTADQASEKLPKKLCTPVRIGDGMTAL